MSTAQLALFAPLVTPDYAPGLSLAEQFAEFDAANPHVADALEALAEQWLARHDHVGMKALYERLRWETGVQTEGDVWRLNNNWTAFYARLLVERRPEWADAFRTREQKAAA